MFCCSVSIFIWAVLLHFNTVRWFLLEVFFLCFCGLNICSSVVTLLDISFTIILIEGARQRYLFFKCLFTNVFIMAYLVILVTGCVSNYLFFLSLLVYQRYCYCCLNNVSNNCSCSYGISILFIKLIVLIFCCLSLLVMNYFFNLCLIEC